MKKILALGLAAATALGALAMSSGADARPMFWPHPHPYPAPFFWSHPHSGFYLNFNFGPSYPRYVINPHVRWCLENYRTYNPHTDTFHPKIGVTAVCVSPWWTYR